MEYFPLAAGNQWLYNSTDSSTNTPSLIFDVTAAVNGTKTVQGQLATIVTRTNSSTAAAPTDQYYASSGGGISYLGTTDPADTITPLLIPYPQLLFPVTTGTVSSITGKNLAFGKDAAGKAITLSLTQTIVFQLVANGAKRAQCGLSRQSRSALVCTPQNNAVGTRDL